MSFRMDEGQTQKAHSESFTTWQLRSSTKAQGSHKSRQDKELSHPTFRIRSPLHNKKKRTVTERYGRQLCNVARQRPLDPRYEIKKAEDNKPMGLQVNIRLRHKRQIFSVSRNKEITTAVPKPRSSGPHEMLASASKSCRSRRGAMKTVRQKSGSQSKNVVWRSSTSSQFQASVTPTLTQRLL